MRGENSGRERTLVPPAVAVIAAAVESTVSELNGGVLQAASIRLYQACVSLTESVDRKWVSQPGCDNLSTLLRPFSFSCCITSYPVIHHKTTKYNYHITGQRHVEG